MADLTFDDRKTKLVNFLVFVILTIAPTLSLIPMDYFFYIWVFSAHFVICYCVYRCFGKVKDGKFSVWLPVVLIIEWVFIHFMYYAPSISGANGALIFVFGPLYHWGMPLLIGIVWALNKLASGSR